MTFRCRTLRLYCIALVVIASPKLAIAENYSKDIIINYALRNIETIVTNVYRLDSVDSLSVNLLEELYPGVTITLSEKSGELCTGLEMKRSKLAVQNYEEVRDIVLDGNDIELSISITNPYVDKISYMEIKRRSSELRQSCEFDKAYLVDRILRADLGVSARDKSGKVIFSASYSNMLIGYGLFPIR